MPLGPPKATDWPCAACAWSPVVCLVGFSSLGPYASTTFPLIPPNPSSFSPVLSPKDSIIDKLAVLHAAEQADGEKKS